MDRSERLIRSGLILASDLSLETVLQRIVDEAVDLTDATYGALGVLGPDGGIAEFVTTGITAEQRRPATSVTGRRSADGPRGSPRSSTDQNGLVTISTMITATTRSSAARALRTAGSRSAVRISGVTSPRAFASVSSCSNTLP